MIFVANTCRCHLSLLSALQCEATNKGCYFYLYRLLTWHKSWSADSTCTKSIKVWAAVTSGNLTTVCEPRTVTRKWTFPFLACFSSSSSANKKLLFKCPMAYHYGHDGNISTCAKSKTQLPVTISGSQILQLKFPIGRNTRTCSQWLPWWKGLLAFPNSKRWLGLNFGNARKLSKMV